jgi:hypothetical protein
MNRKHPLVEELSIIQTLDLIRDREGHLGKCKVIGICLGVQKAKGSPALNLGDHGKVARTFEILWLDTQIKSTHVQFEDGHFDAFINEYVVRVYTQEELMNEACTNRS